MARLIDKLCGECSELMTDVWRGETKDGKPKFKGWYCPACRRYEPAIFRELQFYWDEYGKRHRLNGK